MAHFTGSRSSVGVGFPEQSDLLQKERNFLFFPERKRLNKRSKLKEEEQPNVDGAVPKGGVTGV